MVFDAMLKTTRLTRLKSASGQARIAIGIRSTARAGCPPEPEEQELAADALVLAPAGGQEQDEADEHFVHSDLPESG